MFTWLTYGWFCDSSLIFCFSLLLLLWWVTWLVCSINRLYFVRNAIINCYYLSRNGSWGNGCLNLSFFDLACALAVGVWHQLFYPRAETLSHRCWLIIWSLHLVWSKLGATSTHEWAASYRSCPLLALCCWSIPFVLMSPVTQMLSFYP